VVGRKKKKIKKNNKINSIFHLPYYKTKPTWVSSHSKIQMTTPVFQMLLWLLFISKKKKSQRRHVMSWGRLADGFLWSWNVNNLDGGPDWLDQVKPMEELKGWCDERWKKKKKKKMFPLANVIFINCEIRRNIHLVF